VAAGNSYDYGLLVRVRLGTLRICVANHRMTLRLVRAGAACVARKRGLFWTPLLFTTVFARIPRNMRIAAPDLCSWHDSLGTYRRKCTGVPYVRVDDTWYIRGSDTCTLVTSKHES
jgi:hypothetical protein